MAPNIWISLRDAGAGLNQHTAIAYNAVGDAVSVSDPRGSISTRSYDAARRVVTTTDPNALITAFSYDPNGSLVQTRQSSNGALLRSTATTYTLTGKPATTTDANGNTTSFAYDVLDRISSVTDATARRTSYAYDALSRQVSITNAGVQASPLLRKSYTPDGLLASLTDANNRTTSFVYDGLGRLATTTYPLGRTETQTYDADGNVLTRKTRAGQIFSFAYDTLNRLTTKTPPSSAPVVSYRYDLNNRLIGASDSSAAIATPPTGTSFATNISYDATNRPAAVSWSPAPAAATPTISVAFTHSYNNANQRVGQTASDNSWLNYPAATPSTVNYTANALNQYTAVNAVTPSYDGNGNLTSDGTFTFGYDAENRLTSAIGAGNTVSYTYDAQGRRKTRTVNGTTTVFVATADSREVMEYAGAGGAVQRWYAYGTGSNNVLAQMNVPANTRATFIPDMLGSLIASIDSASGAVSKIGYLPYGKSAATPPFGFTGQRIDPEAGGLYYYRARHYSPAWGRFMQADPIGYAGGNNLYAYVGNDPLNHVDPFGLAADSTQQAFNTTQLGPATGNGLGASNEIQAAAQIIGSAQANDASQNAVPAAMSESERQRLFGEKSIFGGEGGGGSGGGLSRGASGPATNFTDLTNKGSKVSVVGVDASSQQFATQLELSGFQRSVIQDTNIVRYSNGSLEYVFRPSNTAGTKIDVILDGRLIQSYVPSR